MVNIRISEYQNVGMSERRNGNTPHHGRPLRAAAPRVRRALQACLAHLLKEQRNAAPVCVGAGAPTTRGQICQLCVRHGGIVQHSQRALPVVAPQRVRVCQGAHDVRFARRSRGSAFTRSLFTRRKAQSTRGEVHISLPARCSGTPWVLAGTKCALRGCAQRS